MEGIVSCSFVSFLPHGILQGCRGHISLLLTSPFLNHYTLTFVYHLRIVLHLSILISK